jgi:hypothetical protein
VGNSHRSSVQVLVDWVVLQAAVATAARHNTQLSGPRARRYAAQTEQRSGSAPCTASRDGERCLKYISQPCRGLRLALQQRTLAPV